jgi:hypothetical protein
MGFDKEYASQEIDFCQQKLILHNKNAAVAEQSWPREAGRLNRMHYWEPYHLRRSVAGCNMIIVDKNLFY